YIHDHQFLSVWVGVGAEGGSFDFQPDGGLGFLFREWISLRLSAMSEDELLKLRQSAGKQARATQYTGRDFQLEVLERLAEAEALTEGLQRSWKSDLQK